MGRGHLSTRVRSMIDDDPEIEESPLSGIVSREGMTVRVEIYRLVEGETKAGRLRWSTTKVDRPCGRIGLPLTKMPMTSFTERWRLKAFSRF
jgi:hypothetical protein